MEKDALKHLPDDRHYSFIVDLILDELLFKFRKEKLLKEIDKSLMERNKDEFLRLTNELNSILGF